MVGDGAAMTAWSTIEEAAAAIQLGSVVGMPTETVYGLAGDATNAAAVAQIFAVKRRPHFDPLIIHVADIEQAQRWAVFDERARLLAQACWPGPLTLVLKRRAGIADLVTSGLDTVAVRCPDHPQAQQLLQRCGTPLAAPSANRFGRLSPTSPEAVAEQLGDEVVHIIDGGPCAVGVESTIVQFEPQPLILRPGGLSQERIAEVLACPVPISQTPPEDAGLALPAPGMLASHYAPLVPLVLRNGPWPEDPGVARLAWMDAGEGAHTACVLSPRGDLRIAATRLFTALRELQAREGVHTIMAELVPAEGLGLAINDRLRRAAGIG